MSDCLSCAELEQKICDLAEAIAASSCEATIWKEGDTTQDPRPGLDAKVSVLETYKELYLARKCGPSDELYEFIHVPCVTPYTCVGDTCRTVPSVRDQRRYRR